STRPFSGGMMKQLKWPLLVVVLAGSFFGGGWILRRGMTRPVVRPLPAGPDAGNRLVHEGFKNVRSYAADSLQEHAIYRRPNAGMLAELGDPYAAIVSERDTASLEHPSGPPPQGMYLDLVDDYVSVVAVVPNSPAAAASIQPGDLVLRIDQTSAE